MTSGLSSRTAQGADSSRREFPGLENTNVVPGRELSADGAESTEAGQRANGMGSGGAELSSTAGPRAPRLRMWLSLADDTAEAA